MGVFDLLGIQKKQEQATQRAGSDDTKQVGDHTIKKHGSVSKQQLDKAAWTPDKVAQDGQVVAGDVDEAHERFLKTTTFID